MLENIKAGDKIVVASSGFGDTKYLLKKVDRITKTQIVVGNTKFRRATGIQITSNQYHKDRLYIVTDDIMKKVHEYQAKLRKYHLVKYFGEIDWNRFTSEQLNDIKVFIGRYQ